MVIVDMVAKLAKHPRVITLDTGRLPAETYQMIETVRERYGIQVEVIYPDAGELESMVARHGPNLFYRETALRMLCCNIRKVRPLERKLKELKAWAVGLRRSQNDSRSDVRRIDLDAAPAKISPLADWTREMIWRYVVKHDVPYNPLHDRNYPSIGCTHCTRAVQPGEDPRAGRWSGFGKTECGLHTSASAPAALVHLAPVGVEE